MAVAGTLLLVGRAGLFVSLITIVTVPIWAILGNLLRIYSIVIGITYFGIDFSAGALHTVLGLLTFSLAAWAHWSSVQFLNWLSMVGFAAPAGLRFAARNVVLAPHGTNFENSEPQCASMRAGFESDYSHLSQQASALRLKESSVALARGRDVPSKETVSDMLPRWTLVFPGGLLLATPLLIASALFKQLESMSLPKLDADVARLLPTKNDLPRTQIGGQQVEFSIQERGRDDLMGQHSRAWSFANSDTKQTLSLDLPFRGWHELWMCYELTGWKALERRLVNSDDAGLPLAWPYFEVRLENADGEFAILHFSHFVKSGEPFIYSQADARAGYADRNTRWILPTILKQLRQMQEPIPVTFQFQLLSRTLESATDEQIAQFQSLFFEAREKIREKSIPAFRKLMNK